MRCWWSGGGELLEGRSARGRELIEGREMPKGAGCRRAPGARRREMPKGARSQTARDAEGRQKPDGARCQTAVRAAVELEPGWAPWPHFAPILHRTLDAGNRAANRVISLIDRPVQRLLHARQLRGSAQSMRAQIREGSGALPTLTAPPLPPLGTSRPSAPRALRHLAPFGTSRPSALRALRLLAPFSLSRRLASRALRPLAPFNQFAPSRTSRPSSSSNDYCTFTVPCIPAWIVQRYAYVPAAAGMTTVLAPEL
jgi:hypothetical protein